MNNKYLKVPLSPLAKVDASNRSLDIATLTLQPIHVITDSFLENLHA